MKLNSELNFSNSVDFLEKNFSNFVKRYNDKIFSKSLKKQKFLSVFDVFEFYIKHIGHEF